MQPCRRRGISVFRIRKNGVQVGTVTFAAGATTGTIAFTDSTFPAGSLFELWPPSTIDAALDRVSISFAVSPPAEGAIAVATFNKFNQFVEDLAEKVHNLQSDTLKNLLTNTAPVATNRSRGI
jgi:hypothetical protein